MKTGKFFMKLISSLDFLGDLIIFTVYKKETPQLFIGRLMSGMLITYLIVLFSFKMIDPMGKTNPSISSYTITRRNPESMNLNRNSIPIAIGSMDDYGGIFNEKIELKASLVTYDGKNESAPFNYEALNWWNAEKIVFQT